VRKHAAEFGVNRSALALSVFRRAGQSRSVAMNYTAPTRPDFAAPIYPAYNWAIKGNGVPRMHHRIYSGGSDDPLRLAPQSVAIYQDWIAARKPAELHLYSKSGHGFGMRQQHLRPTIGSNALPTGWTCRVC